MTGALLAGADKRPRWYVLMAATTSFPAWYLLGKKVSDRDSYLAQMAPIDVLKALRQSHADAYVFQFSTHDEYVSADDADKMFAAAPAPRGAFFYDTDHALNTPLAFADRQAWLVEHLFGP